MKTLYVPLLFALLAPAAHADLLSMQVNMFQASAGGCTAQFMYRQLVSDSNISGAPFGEWIKVSDTCGMFGFNDTSNFAGMGLCKTGFKARNLHCSEGGYVTQSVLVHENCGVEVLTQLTPVVCYGQPI